MNATRPAVAVLLSIFAACGSPASPSANSGKPKSFEAALGLDQATINAREAKVQEAVRACMKAQGFDYVPIDPSQNGLTVSIGGEGFGKDDPDFRRTKGYGISTGLGAGRAPVRVQGSDPNEKIRAQLSEADQKAYDAALLGPAAAAMRPKDGEAGGFVVVGQARREKGGGPPTDQGCMGKAQHDVPGGPAALGDSLQELQQRVESDPRLVEANKQWATCMAASGFSQFEQPDDIVQYLFGELQKLQNPNGAPPDEGGMRSFSIGGDIDQAKLARLQQEELSLATRDGGCAKKTGRAAVAKRVRDEAQQRFLDEHPDLTGGK